MAKAAWAPLLGQIPIDPALARFCDEGNIERYNSEIVTGFADAINRAVAAKAS